MRRLTRLLVVLLGLLVGAAPLADCIVDPASASQMACCAAMVHDCGAAAMNEGCCPTDDGSSRRFLASASVQVHPAPLVSVGPEAWTARATSTSTYFAAFEAFDREILKLPERPTYLLVSSFLI